MHVFDQIDDVWNYWKSLFISIIDSHALLQKVRVRQKGPCDEWIDSELRGLIRSRNYYRRKYMKGCDPVD